MPIVPPEGRKCAKCKVRALDLVAYKTGWYHENCIPTKAYWRCETNKMKVDSPSPTGFKLPGGEGPLPL